VALRPADTAELTDLLRFTRDWLVATGSDAIDDSLAAALGPGGYDARALAQDLDRFVLLLDGTADGDGDVLFANPT